MTFTIDKTTVVPLTDRKLGFKLDAGLKLGNARTLLRRLTYATFLMLFGIILVVFIVVLNTGGVPTVLVLITVSVLVPLIIFGVWLEHVVSYQQAILRGEYRTLFVTSRYYSFDVIHPMLNSNKQETVTQAKAMLLNENIVAADKRILGAGRGLEALRKVSDDKETIISIIEASSIGHPYLSTDYFTKLRQDFKTILIRKRIQYAKQVRLADRDMARRSARINSFTLGLVE